MPQTPSGFTFVLPIDAVKILTASETVMQSELDEPSNVAIDESVWLPALVSNAMIILGYVGFYPLEDIDNHPLLAKINAWMANWDREIYGIRDGQNRRYKQAFELLCEIRDNRLPLFGANGQPIALLAPEESARVDGADYGLDSNSVMLDLQIKNYDRWMNLNHSRIKYRT